MDEITRKRQRMNSKRAQLTALGKDAFHPDRRAMGSLLRDGLGAEVVKIANSFHKLIEHACAHAAALGFAPHDCVLAQMQGSSNPIETTLYILGIPVYRAFVRFEGLELHGELEVNITGEMIDGGKRLEGWEGIRDEAIAVERRANTIHKIEIKGEVTV